ncbi:MAG: hypothetical protein OQL28_13305 [Sedimenticola sp.]|nr:hypothetical protein [Sedimenticola sp.]
MKRVTVATVLLLPSLSALAENPQAHRVDVVTGAKTWETRSNGVHFSLTQLLPDQLRAFYVNRGFTLQQAEPYATSCVYMAVIRNDDAPGVIHFVSSDWPVSVEGGLHALLPVEGWLERLSAAGVRKSALVAFRWAQFPPEQSYRPGGDWNQGMLSIGLPAGSRFDITATWDIDGETYRAGLKEVQCAG